CRADASTKRSPGRREAKLSTMAAVSSVEPLSQTRTSQSPQKVCAVRASSWAPIVAAPLRTAITIVTRWIAGRTPPWGRKVATTLTGPAWRHHNVSMPWSVSFTSSMYSSLKPSMGKNVSKEPHEKFGIYHCRHSEMHHGPRELKEDTDTSFLQSTL